MEARAESLSQVETPLKYFHQVEFKILYNSYVTNLKFNLGVSTFSSKEFYKFQFQSHGCFFTMQLNNRFTIFIKSSEGVWACTYRQ